MGRLSVGTLESAAALGLDLRSRGSAHLRAAATAPPPSVRLGLTCGSDQPPASASPQSPSLRQVLRRTLEEHLIGWGSRVMVRPPPQPASAHTRRTQWSERQPSWMTRTSHSGECKDSERCHAALGPGGELVSPAQPTQRLLPPLFPLWSLGLETRTLRHVQLTTGELPRLGLPDPSCQEPLPADLTVTVSASRGCLRISHLGACYDRLWGAPERLWSGHVLGGTDAAGHRTTLRESLSAQPVEELRMELVEFLEDQRKSVRRLRCSLFDSRDLFDPRHHLLEMNAFIIPIVQMRELTFRKPLPSSPRDHL
ncbi:uncharacterized protein [Saccopteryx bilineata]|uniref:uncharacterized protein n=1 Tax=Saccopteryx bilineata TaxID=59482 RepID=UPI00338DFBE9